MDLRSIQSFPKATFEIRACKGRESETAVLRIELLNRWLPDGVRTNRVSQKGHASHTLCIVLSSFTCCNICFQCAHLPVCPHLHMTVDYSCDEFTRLAETRLAQHSLKYINTYLLTLTQLNIP